LLFFSLGVSATLLCIFKTKSSFDLKKGWIVCSLQKSKVDKTSFLYIFSLAVYTAIPIHFSFIFVLATSFSISLLLLLFSSRVKNSVHTSFGLLFPAVDTTLALNRCLPCNLRTTRITLL